VSLCTGRQYKKLAFVFNMYFKDSKCQQAKIEQSFLAPKTVNTGLDLLEVIKSQRRARFLETCTLLT